jgi:hypothetical protein
LGNIQVGDWFLIEKQVTQGLVCLGEVLDELCSLLFGESADVFWNLIGLDNVQTNLVSFASPE